MALGEVVAKVASYSCRHVVLTGGEPLLFSELPELVGQLKRRGCHITVETAGTLWQEWPAGVGGGAIDLASVSPKLANSTPWQREGGRFAKAHEAHRINLDVLVRFASDPAIVERQWKFVVAAQGDLVEIQALISQINARLVPERAIPPADVLLLPEGTDLGALERRAGFVVELCKRHGYRYCPRLHIALFGNTRGT
jgi:7-carboxy-7-deazaguanine synthase